MTKKELEPVIKKTLNLNAKLVQATERNIFKGVSNNFKAKVEKGLELLLTQK